MIIWRVEGVQQKANLAHVIGCATVLEALVEVGDDVDCGSWGRRRRWRWRLQWWRWWRRVDPVPAPWRRGSWWWWLRRRRRRRDAEHHRYQGEQNDAAARAENDQQATERAE